MGSVIVAYRQLRSVLLLVLAFCFSYGTTLYTIDPTVIVEFYS